MKNHIGWLILHTPPSPQSSKLTLTSSPFFPGGIKKATSGSIFYGNACVGMILFIRLARRWPALVRDWQLVETSMSRFGTPRLGWRFTVMSSVLFSLAFVEHGLHNWLNTRPGGKDDISSMSMRGGAKVGANFSIDNSVWLFVFTYYFLVGFSFFGSKSQGKTSPLSLWI